MRTTVQKITKKILHIKPHLKIQTENNIFESLKFKLTLVSKLWLTKPLFIFPFFFQIPFMFLKSFLVWFGFFVEWHINFGRLFNVPTPSFEKNSRGTI